jgi:hypothetical protein
MDAEDQLERFLGRYTPEIAAIGRDAIARLRARLPEATVLVYDNYNALAVGFAPSEKASQGILSVALYPRGVNFFFLQGHALDDPEKRLKGSGTVVRHIRLQSAADLDEPYVFALIDQALAKAKFPLDPGAKGRLVIKSVSAKQRPRRPDAVPL